VSPWAKHHPLARNLSVSARQELIQRLIARFDKLEDVANALGVTKVAVHYWLKGRNAPSNEAIARAVELLKLVDFLEVLIDDTTQYLEDSVNWLTEWWPEIVEEIRERGNRDEIDNFDEIERLCKRLEQWAPKTVSVRAKIYNLSRKIRCEVEK